MTTKNINTTEFKEWGERIWKVSEILLDKGNESPEKKAEILKVISAFCVKIHLGNTFALEVFRQVLGEKFEQLPKEVRETKFDFPCENGVNKKMTGQEWSLYLHQRVEDHHRTRVGKDIGDQDLPLILQRLRKIDALDKGKEEKQEQLLSEIYHTNKKNYDLLYGILDLKKKIFDINKKDLFEIFGNIEESIKQSPYFFEDFSQILYKAQEAIEDKKEKPEAPEKKEKKKEEKKHEIKTLEEEIKELERQNKDLKEKLSNTSLDPAKKTLLEEDLKENNKQREATQARLDNLQRELKNTDNDSKNNLVIGLGIFAAVVAVICLIILLVRPRRRDQYQY